MSPSGVLESSQQKFKGEKKIVLRVCESTILSDNTPLLLVYDYSVRTINYFTSVRYNTLLAAV